MNSLSTVFTAILLAAILPHPVSAQTAPPRRVVPFTAPLQGFVDMHTHPVAQFAFGEELFFGGNDGDPAVALGDCSCFHNADLTVNCPGQNAFRNSLVDSLEDFGHEKTAAWPDFSAWPTHESLLHQQMWWEWIRRAKEGGLRVLVGLAVHSHVLADAAETAGPNDDLRAIDRQIDELIAFVARHPDFMEVAYSSEDLIRIAGQDKLSVIVGVESDNLGNFYDPADRKDGVYNPNPTSKEIEAEIDRLYDKGVRYIFPIHLTDNLFGATAINDSFFNVANKYNTGRELSIETVDSVETGITFKLQAPYQDFGLIGDVAMTFTGTILPGEIMPNVEENYTAHPDPGLTMGHRNEGGLTPQGRVAIAHMMRRGMIIDVDHMSERMLEEVLPIGITNDYPLNSGHNTLRSLQDPATENSRTVSQLNVIRDLGGLLGLGHGGSAGAFLEAFRAANAIMGGRQLAIGTDVNGLFALPGPPELSQQISYSPRLTRAVTGTRTWDYNQDGFAHYGLFPDFVESVRQAGMSSVEEDVFFSSAQHFCEMWAKCEGRALSLSGTPPPSVTFTPSPIGPLCPTALLAGDRDFGGNGPHLQSTVRLELSPDATRLEVVIFFAAEELGGNESATAGEWRRPLFTAPAGTTITGITSGLSSAIDFVSPAAGPEFGACNDGDIHSPALTGNLLSEYLVIGDTGGDDISDDADCKCDTRIESLIFNPITVTLAATPPRHESIQVFPNPGWPIVTGDWSDDSGAWQRGLDPLSGRFVLVAEGLNLKEDEPLRRTFPKGSLRIKWSVSGEWQGVIELVANGVVVTEADLSEGSGCLEVQFDDEENEVEVHVTPAAPVPGPLLVIEGTEFSGEDPDQEAPLLTVSYSPDYQLVSLLPSGGGASSYKIECSRDLVTWMEFASGQSAGWPLLFHPLPGERRYFFRAVAEQ